MKFILQGIIGAFIMTASLYGDSSILSLNEKNYQTNVSSFTYVVVDVYANWCGPCKKFGPVVESVNQEYGDRYHFMKLHAPENESLVKSLNVRGMPTVIFYKNGKEVGRSVGYMDRDQFIKVLKQNFGG